MSQSVVGFHWIAPVVDQRVSLSALISVCAPQGALTGSPFSVGAEAPLTS